MEVVDVLGVGFGPSNLALALALEDEFAAQVPGGLEFRFLERRDGCRWHPGMLLPDTTLQISFLKDLVTMRNPTSRFSFLSYLRAQGRLHKFVNLRTFYPSRIEYDDYLRWAAGQVQHRVRYDVDVESIQPAPARPDGPIDRLRVCARDGAGAVHEYLARVIVVATGGSPRLPAQVAVGSGRRAFHSSQFLERIRDGFPERERAYSFVVVGSGQSAAEILDYLLGTYPNASVTGVLRQWAYKPSDSSEFVNEIFLPDATDLVFNAPPEVRPMLVDRYRDTNYAVVEPELITRIYRGLYEAELRNDRRGRLITLHELERCAERPDGVDLTLRDVTTDRRSHLRADAIVLATGYQWGPSTALLGGLDHLLARSAAGRYVVGRDYALEADPRLEARVFLQGFSEETHGLSETLLSVLAIRSGEIATTIVDGELARRARAEAPARQLEPAGGPQWQ